MDWPKVNYVLVQPVCSIITLLIHYSLFLCIYSTHTHTSQVVAAVDEKHQNQDKLLRRSPRLVKRARNTDHNIEFEVSDSQEVTREDGERRRKRRKASIASRSIIV